MIVCIELKNTSTAKDVNYLILKCKPINLIAFISTGKDSKNLNQINADNSQLLRKYAVASKSSLCFTLLYCRL